jgi:hypothetical protein
MREEDCYLRLKRVAKGAHLLFEAKTQFSAKKVFNLD